MVELCESCLEKNSVYRGKVVYFPKGNGKGIDKEEVFRLKEESVSVSKIAEKFGVTSRRIFQILQKKGH